MVISIVSITLAAISILLAVWSVQLAKRSLRQGHETDRKLEQFSEWGFKYNGLNESEREKLRRLYKDVGPQKEFSTEEARNAIPKLTEGALMKLVAEGWLIENEGIYSFSKGGSRFISRVER